MGPEKNKERVHREVGGSQPRWVHRTGWAVNPRLGDRNSRKWVTTQNTTSADSGYTARSGTASHDAAPRTPEARGLQRRGSAHADTGVPPAPRQRPGSTGMGFPRETPTDNKAHHHPAPPEWGTPQERGRGGPGAAAREGVRGGGPGARKRAPPARRPRSQRPPPARGDPRRRRRRLLRAALRVLQRDHSLHAAAVVAAARQGLLGAGQEVTGARRRGGAEPGGWTRRVGVASTSRPGPSCGLGTPSPGARTGTLRRGTPSPEARTGTLRRGHPAPGKPGQKAAPVLRPGGAVGTAPSPRGTGGEIEAWGGRKEADVLFRGLDR